MINIEGGCLIDFSMLRFLVPRGFQSLHSFLCYFHHIFMPLSLTTCFISKFVQSTEHFFFYRNTTFIILNEIGSRGTNILNEMCMPSSIRISGKNHFSKMAYCQNSLTDPSVISKDIISRVCIVTLTVCTPHGYKIINVGNR